VKATVTWKLENSNLWFGQSVEGIVYEDPVANISNHTTEAEERVISYETDVYSVYTKGSYKNSSKPNYGLFDREVAGDNRGAALKGGSGSGNISTPNSGQGFSPNGYNPQQGERTLDGYVKNHASPEISLHTDSAGFNNNNGNVGGDFKRFGAESHGGVSPHVHQPQRNVAPNGNIYGTVGTKTANGGVTSPSTKDVKQLYEYLTNGKYH